MDKHDRPHKCRSPGCKVQPFTNPGDLKRHQLTVHGGPRFICPCVTCKRHLRGFARKDNLIEHQKRTHALEPNTFVSLSPRGEEPPDQIKEGESEDSNSEDVELTDSTAAEKRLLKAKLHELERMRANWLVKVDGDIAAVKRTLSLI